MRYTSSFIRCAGHDALGLDSGLGKTHEAALWKMRGRNYC